MLSTQLIFALFVLRTLSSPLNNRSPTSTLVNVPLLHSSAATPYPLLPNAASPAAAPNPTAPTTLVSNLSPTSPTYTAIALQHHNVHRANHSAASLTWSSNLASLANEKVSSCSWDESIPNGAGSVGMNLAWGSGTYLSPGQLALVISGSWYDNEIGWYPGYGNANPSLSNFNNWGHFSQLVWPSTSQVGCYTTYCSYTNNIGSAGYYTACLYSSAGNCEGQFNSIHAPSGHPNVAIVGNTVTGMTGANAGY